ncbi:MAG: hypothetical protein Kow0090_03010 [Myxococcota bacterium]
MVARFEFGEEIAFTVRKGQEHFKSPFDEQIKPISGFAGGKDGVASGVSSLYHSG